MGLNVSRALQIAGQGLGDYAQFMFRKQAYDRERADQQEQRNWERAFRQAEAAADRESERQERIDRDRQFYGTGTDRELDRLNRMGVMPGADFGRDYKASMLPDVQPGISDTGGLVLQGLKQRGQAGVGDLYGALPDAMNRLVAGKGISEPLPGGGMAMLEPSVRASLMNAEMDHSLALARLGQGNQPTPVQAKAAQDEEMQGRAILSTMGVGGTAPAEQKAAFTRAYSAIIGQNPGTSPGRAAAQAWQGISGARPDLTPPRQSTATPRPLSVDDQLLRWSFGEDDDSLDLLGADDLGSGAPAGAMSASPGEITDPLAEQRAEWDALARQFGAEATAREIGPRP